MLVSWSPVTSSLLEVTGYDLYMDNGLGGPFTKVYDGSANALKTTFTATVIPSRTYRFKVKAIDINGGSNFTAPISAVACIEPSNVNSPSISDITNTDYTVSWTTPNNEGGCYIKEVKVYRDDGNSVFSNLVATITDGSLTTSETLDVSN
jgi:hypothetical protein